MPPAAKRDQQSAAPGNKVAVICDEGWRLYDAWCANVSDRQLRAAYMKHRNTCPNCTPPVTMREYEEAVANGS